MSKRRDGWYWVRFDDSSWQAAHWAGKTWCMVGDDVPREEDELLENAICSEFKVGPRIPTPEEPWQCVPG